MPQRLIAELTNKNAELTARVAELSLALHQVEAVSQVAAGLAHDFRNALQIVLGEAEILVSAVQDPDLLESAKAVLLAGSHAEAISRDLLALARRAQANVGVVDSAELLSRCQRLIQGIVQKRASCVFTVDPNIGAVAVEPQRLEAALINLSANARDAMPKGGQLRVSGFNVAKGIPLPPELPAGEYVAFSVEDTGTGMSPQVLARATEAFFTTKDPEHGTGLGLAMVSAFAARSGGALRIDSEVGRGTRVELFLPRARLSTDPPPEPQFPAVAFDRLLKRVHTEWLSELLRAWRNSCPEKGLPHLADFEGALRGRSDHLLLLAVDRVTSPPALRLVRMGDGLTRALQRTALGMLPDDALEPAGTLRAAYGRVLDSRFPTYERARYALGDGPSTEFERLILPASLDGETVSHLLGVIVLPQNLQAEGV
jgi:nitrogen-specific signal transduction histidine kinase